MAVNSRGETAAIAAGGLPVKTKTKVEDVGDEANQEQGSQDLCFAGEQGCRHNDSDCDTANGVEPDGE